MANSQFGQDNIRPRNIAELTDTLEEIDGRSSVRDPMHGIRNRGQFHRVGSKFGLARRIFNLQNG